MASGLETSLRNLQTASFHAATANEKLADASKKAADDLAHVPPVEPPAESLPAAIYGGTNEPFDGRTIQQGQIPWFGLRWSGPIPAFDGLRLSDGRDFEADNPFVKGEANIPVLADGLTLGVHEIVITFYGGGDLHGEVAARAFYTVVEAAVDPPTPTDPDEGWPIPEKPSQDLIDLLEATAENDRNVEFVKDISGDGATNVARINAALAKVGWAGLVWVVTGQKVPFKGTVEMSEGKAQLCGHHTLIKDENRSGHSFHLTGGQPTLIGFDITQVGSRTGGQAIVRAYKASLQEAATGTDTWGLYKRLYFSGPFDGPRLHVSFPEMNHFEEILGNQLHGSLIKLDKDGRQGGGSIDNAVIHCRSLKPKGGFEAFWFEDSQSLKLVGVQVLAPFALSSPDNYAGIRLIRCHAMTASGLDTEMFDRNDNASAWGVVAEDCNNGRIEGMTTWEMKNVVKLRNCNQMTVGPLRRNGANPTTYLRIDADCDDCRWTGIPGEVDNRSATSREL